MTRYKVGTGLLDSQGQTLDLLALLQQATTPMLELAVRLGVHHQIPCRLVAQRIPPEKLPQRQQQLDRHQSRKQTTASGLKWALLEWSIYLTNARPDQLRAEEVLLMARVRWQIELLFKLWKQVTDIDDWRTEQPWRILCEVYAKLIACIVQHWLMLAGHVHDLQRSLTQAAPVIRHWAWPLAYSLSNPSLLAAFIAHVGHILATSCRIDPSATALPTFQRIKLCRA